MGSIEVFLTFMMMDINRNALRRDRSQAIQSKVEQLTNLWGDESWEQAAYSSEGKLFDDPEKVSNERFEEAWRERLKKKAGFKFVSEPMPMKTRTNAVIYYLYFGLSKARRRRHRGRYFQQVQKASGALNGHDLQHRMDRNDLEPGHGLHEDQPGMQTLLRRENGETAACHGFRPISQWFWSDTSPRPDRPPKNMEETENGVRQFDERSLPRRRASGLYPPNLRHHGGLPATHISSPYEEKRATSTA
jgi:hypothetical protein